MVTEQLRARLAVSKHGLPFFFFFFFFHYFVSRENGIEPHSICML
jgi:hypothetical protein